MCCIVCLQVVINGVGSANGDQDTENTELMAVYTKENQITEKVKCRTESRISCQQNADDISLVVKLLLSCLFPITTVICNV